MVAVDRSSREARPALDELSRWLRQWLDRAYCRILVFDDRTDRCTIAAAAPAPRRGGFDWKQDLPLAARLADLPSPLGDLKSLILDEAALRDSVPFTLPLDAHCLKELLVVPIAASGRLVGLLELGECRDRGSRAAFHGADRRLTAARSGREGPTNLAELAGQAAQLVLRVLQSDERSAAERRRRGHLQAIRDAEHRAARVRRGKLTRKEVLADLLRITVRCFRAHGADPRTGAFGTLLLWRPRDLLVLEAVYPRGLRKQIEQVVAPERCVRVDQAGITGAAVLTGKPQLGLDLPHGHRPLQGIPATRSQIAAPIISCERVVGVLDVESESPHGFDRADLETLETLAGFVAVALANHRIEHIARAAQDLHHAMALSVPRIGRMLHSARAQDRSALVARLRHQVAESSVQVRLTQDLMAAAMVLHEAPLKLRRTSLGKLVHAVVDSLHEVAEQKRLRVTLPDDRVVLWIDRDRMRQVVTNLVAHAIRHAEPSGRIDVRVSADAERVRVEVTDDGPHRLSEAARDRLFEPYSQASATTAAGAPAGPRQGQGLGLSIARTFVELHGGHIWARPNDPTGLTIAFELPRGRRGAGRP